MLWVGKTAHALLTLEIGGYADASSSGTFSLAYDAADSRGRLGGPTLKSLPPGAAPPETKAASKNARRRRAKGAKGGAGDGEPGEAGAAAPAESAAASANGSNNAGGDADGTAERESGGGRAGNGHAAPLGAEPVAGPHPGHLQVK